MNDMYDDLRVACLGHNSPGVSRISDSRTHLIFKGFLDRIVQLQIDDTCVASQLSSPSDSVAYVSFQGDLFIRIRNPEVLVDNVNHLSSHNLRSVSMNN